MSSTSGVNGAFGIGIDVSRLREVDWRDIPFHHAECPGALLRLTKVDQATLQRGGEIVAWSKYVDGNEYGEARIFCKRLVHAWVGSAGFVVYAGRCVSCEELERLQRAELRSRMQVGGAK